MNNKTKIQFFHVRELGRSYFSALDQGKRNIIYLQMSLPTKPIKSKSFKSVF